MTTRCTRGGSHFCGNPSVSAKPGLTVCTRIPSGRNSAATVREKASCACFDAEYGPLGGPATTPETETMLTTSDGAAARRPGRNERSTQMPPR